MVQQPKHILEFLQFFQFFKYSLYFSSKEYLKVYPCPYCEKYFSAKESAPPAIHQTTQIASATQPLPLHQKQQMLPNGWLRDGKESVKMTILPSHVNILEWNARAQALWAYGRIQTESSCLETNKHDQIHLYWTL